jgi:hypothetical protein
MEFLEKDLEDIIFNAEKKQLSNKGLYIHGKLLRQVKIGNYGICDLLEYRRPFYSENLEDVFKGQITIFELKQNEINGSTFFQALRYLQGVKSYFEKKGIENNYNYEIILIGRKIKDCDEFVYLPNFLNEEMEGNLDFRPWLRVKLFTYDYDLNGIQFKDCTGYQLRNEGF